MKKASNNILSQLHRNNENKKEHNIEKKFGRMGTMFANIVETRLKITTTNIRDDIRKEVKLANSIRKDTGYDIYEEKIDFKRLPVPWFMSLPYTTVEE